MPIREYDCLHCERRYEAIEGLNDTTPCRHCGSAAVIRKVSQVNYKWNCDPGGSTNPVARANREEARKEGKRERLTEFCQNDGTWGSSQKHD